MKNVNALRSFIFETIQEDEDKEHLAKVAMLDELLEAGNKAFDTLRSIYDIENPVWQALDFWANKGKNVPKSVKKEERKTLKRAGDFAGRSIWKHEGREAEGFLNRVASNDRNRLKVYIDRLVDAPAYTVKDAKDMLRAFNNHMSIWHKFEAYVQQMIEAAEGNIEKFAEGPPEGPLERIAFADERENVPSEKDTPEEKELFKSLNKTIFKSKPMDSKSISLVQQILRSNLYGKIFKKPSETIYRGMTVDEKWLNALVEKVGPSGSTNIDVSLAPSMRKNKEGEITSSWTKSKEAALDFAEDPPVGGPRQKYGVVLSANPADNPPDKFLDMEELYDVGSLADWEDQSEVVAFGPVRIFNVEWFTRSS